MAKTDRRAAERSGRRAEALAALFLRLKFYRIRAMRFKTPVGELDLIARHFGTLVFVEVKQRGNDSEAEALAAVNRKRIGRAADYWLMKHPEDAERPMRFDVIFLAPRRLPRHVRNAFTRTGQ
jgi:putative endonuclease